MRCVFCKGDSSLSKSVEHIVPESLGGKKHTLPPGVVCDKCNNYFAREVEKPFLEDSSIKTLRFNEGIESKKGVIPPMTAVLNGQYPVRLWKDNNDWFAGHVDVHPVAFESLISSDKGTIVFPIPSDDTFLKSTSIVSRFIGKIAIEAFVQRIIQSEHASVLGGFIDDTQFNPLRNHVRRGTQKEWPCNVRRIYNADKRWVDSLTNESYQVINEYDFLLTDEYELYFSIAIFGMEYTINMGGSDIEGYIKWLDSHGNQSPLYIMRDKPGHHA